MGLTSSRRLAYAFVGLLAGDAAMRLYMLLNAREASFLQPMQASRKLKFPVAIQMFALYAVASFVGWALVGVRVVLLKSMLFWGARL